MENAVEIRSYLNHIAQDIEEIKKRLIAIESKNLRKRGKGSEEWRRLSANVTKLWKGKGVLEEIREQREKVW